MSDWLENLKRYALSDDMEYRLTWEDAAIAVEKIERLQDALERIERIVLGTPDQFRQIAREALDE